MKKLLVFFMVLFGISLGAMAEEVGEFWEDGEPHPCATVPDDFPDEKNPYAVYFYTDWDKPLPVCQDAFDRVSRELLTLEQEGGVEYYVLVASADPQGNPEYNKDLSGRRYTYVVNKIMPWPAIDLQKIKSWAAGDVSGRVFEPSKVDNPHYRSVFIYPVWKSPECDEELVNGINDTIAQLEKAKKDYPKQANEIDKILENYKKAHELCPKAGKKLGAEDAKKLANYLKDALVLVNKSTLNLGITDITVNVTDIDTHYYNLTRMVSGLKLSVWRDENGNFNTARLISDSVAGVVLGTVGGIVTSKLVKKNQLKKGFEDLYCAIGGQTVAEYGDDFTVGLR